MGKSSAQLQLYHTQIQQCEWLSVCCLGFTHDLLGPKALGQAHLSNSTIWSTNNLPCELWPAPFHTCQYPWWSSPSPGISSILGLPIASCGLCLVTLTLPHGTKPQLLSKTLKAFSSHAAQTSKMWGSHTLPSSAATLVMQRLPLLDHSSALEENTSQKISAE